MKSKFQFDKKTGTMIPVSDAVAQGMQTNVQSEVKEIKTDVAPPKPVFKEEKRIEVKSESSKAQNNQVVKMQRIDKPSPIMLVNDKGLPESYLDSVTTGIMMFRELEDYDRCQIVDEKTGKVLALISGYALQINFNMTELNTLERIEECLQGIVKLFRHKIMTQAINKGNSESK